MPKVKTKSGIKKFPYSAKGKKDAKEMMKMKEKEKRMKMRKRMK